MSDRGIDELDAVNNDYQRLYKPKPSRLEETGGALKKDVKKHLSQILSPVEEIEYAYIDKDGKIFFEDTVKLTDPHCPFSEPFDFFKTIKMCSKQPRDHELNGKIVHGYVLCYPRGYVNCYGDCPVYLRESK